MSKLMWKAGTMEYPLPAVLVSCGDENVQNVLTIAWTGIICTDPAMTYVSIRKERYSYDIIKRTGEFVINLTTEDLARVTDMAGVKTGRGIDKFNMLGITPEKAPNLNCPMVKESPVSIECKVEEIKELGSHDMFIAKIVSVNVDEKYLDETGKFDLEKCNLIAYSHGNYYTLGNNLGKFGFSVKKK